MTKMKKTLKYLFHNNELISYNYSNTIFLKEHVYYRHVYSNHSLEVHAENGKTCSKNDHNKYER